MRGLRTRWHRPVCSRRRARAAVADREDPLVLRGLQRFAHDQLVVAVHLESERRQQRWRFAGFPVPQFVERDDGYWQAQSVDPGGFPVVLLAKPGLKDHSDAGVGVGINVSDLERSRAFYREFVGLDELAPVDAKVLGTTLYPYRHKETTLFLYHQGDNAHPDNGSAGIQYVVRDSPMVDAKAKHRGGIAVETPLNKLAGFDLVTVWLNDPDGVTNYFAQVGPNSRTAQQARAAAGN